MGKRMLQDPDQPGLPAAVFNRRIFLGAGAVALGSLGLAACGGSSSSSSGGSSGGNATGPVTFGSNASDEVPKKAFQATFAAYKTSGGGDVKVNTVDHNTFQEQINNYLQGRPDDVFTWFAGYRMRFFAKKGLVGDVSDVWEKIGGNFTDAIKTASTGEDGKQYFVPLYNYPWAVHYRKSVFEANGFQPPTTLDEMVTLGQQMKKKGLAPLAFADKDGWPAMGTFDYLNMRINGYDFHINLMGGKEAWDSPKVATVFDTWKRLLEISQPNSLGRTWQEAAQTVAQKKAGMYLLGTFVGQQFAEGAERDDLDLLPVPGGRLLRRGGLGRGAHRRVHDGQAPAERRGSQAPAGIPRLGRGGEHLPGHRLQRRRRAQGRRHVEVQRAAEEGLRAHRRRQVDLPVPRPGRRPHLRVDGGDPGVPVVHQEPG